MGNNSDTPKIWVVRLFQLKTLVKYNHKNLGFAYRFRIYKLV